MKQLSLEDMVRATNIQSLDQALEFAVNHATEFEEVECILIDSFDYDKDVTDDLFKYVNPLYPRDGTQYDFLKRIKTLKAEFEQEMDHMKVLKFCLHHFDITDATSAARKLFDISATDRGILNSCVTSLLKARNLIPNLPVGTVAVLNGHGHSNGNGNGKAPRRPHPNKGRSLKIKLPKAPSEILDHKDNFVQIATPGVFTGLRGEPAALKVTDSNGVFHHWTTKHPDVDVNENKMSYGFVQGQTWLGPWRGLMSCELGRLTKQKIAYESVPIEGEISRRIVHLPDWWVQGQGGEA